MATRPRLRKPDSRWAAFGVAIALYAGFGSVVASIPPLITPISRELGISATEMGAVLGVWQLVYIGTAILAGKLLDHFGMRRTLAAGMLLVAASAALRGVAADFPTLLGAVALFGVGGPTISIGMPKLVATLFLDRERAAALGLGTAAPFLGITFAFAATNSILVELLGDWRGVMFFYGAVIAALTLLWWVVAPRDEGGAATAVEADQPPEPRPGLLELLRVRNVALALIFAPLLFTVGHGMNNWIARLLETRGDTLAEAGYWAALANGLTAVAVLVIPRLVPVGRRRLALSALLVVLATSVLGLVLLDEPALRLAVAVFGLSRFVPTTLVLLILIDTREVGSRAIGTVAGAFFAVAEIGGFGGPFLIGALLDLTGSFVPAAGVLAAFALSLAVMAVFLKERPRSET